MRVVGDIAPLQEPVLHCWGCCGLDERKLMKQRIVPDVTNEMTDWQQRLEQILLRKR